MSVDFNRKCVEWIVKFAKVWKSEEHKNNTKNMNVKEQLEIRKFTNKTDCVNIKDIYDIFVGSLLRYLVCRVILIISFAFAIEISLSVLLSLIFHCLNENGRMFGWYCGICKIWLGIWFDERQSKHTISSVLGAKNQRKREKEMLKSRK